MSTVVRKDKGFFFIRERSKSFTVYYEIQEDNKKSQIRIEPHQYPDFGFSQFMSVNAAKIRCTELNKERKAVRSQLRAEYRAVSQKLISNSFFKPLLVAKFEKYLRDNTFGSDKHFSKLMSHFNFIQEMITEMKLVPIEYSDNTKRIIKYLIDKKVSTSYASKLIALLNRWGTWYSNETRTFYKNVPVPKGTEKHRIEEAQSSKKGTDSKRGVRIESAPLTPEIFEIKKYNIKNKIHANWIYISLWFGLRPSEVDGLKEDFRVATDINSGIKVISIVQTKVSGNEERRTKKIPILYDEQEKALKLIESGNFSRPSSKLVSKSFGQDYNLYCGRKGFTDLMLSRGQKLEHVSRWLGHTSLETTWNSYKRKDLIEFTPIVNKKVK